MFWDIGANIGSFRCMRPVAATRASSRSSPPVNYFLLSANCEVNQLDIDCLLVGVGEKRGVERLEVSQFDPAQSFSFRPRAGKRPSGRQAALIVSIDELVEQFGLPCPTYIKLDVPGLTEAIIAGGQRTLRRQEVREFHIELRERSSAGRRIVQMLEAAGLVAVNRHVHGSTTDVTFVRRLPSRGFLSLECAAAFAMFDVTDTAVPCSGNVISRRTIPPSELPVVAGHERVFTRQRDRLELQPSP